MKRFVKYLMLALVALSFGEVRAEELPYAPGEHIQLTINFKWAFRSDIATVDLNLKEDSDSTWHSMASIRTKPFFDAFYKIRDIYECKFRPDKEVTPVWYHRSVQEGKYWVEASYDWTPDALEMKASIDKSTRPHRDTLYKEDYIIHDIINIFYAVRAQNIGPDNRMDTRFLIVDRDIMEVRARYVETEYKKMKGREEKVPARKIAVAVRSVTPSFDTNNVGLVLDAEWPEGEEFGQEGIFLWLTEDGNRLPVAFKAPLKMGSINGVLEEASGLKYE